MGWLRKWYFNQVAEQLNELAEIMATPIPDLGQKPGGGGYVAMIVLRSIPDHLHNRCWGVHDGHLTGDWSSAESAPKIPLSLHSLRQLNVVFDDRTYVGFGMIKGAWILHKARLVAAERDRKFTSEMDRRHKFYQDLLIPAEKVELIGLIVKEFCEAGPKRFTVDSLLTALRGPGWRGHQWSFVIECKYEFLLQGLVADGVLTGDKVFRPLPTIFGVHEAHQVELRRWKERSEIDRNMLKIQKSVKRATKVIAAATCIAALATGWAARDKPTPELPENNSPPTGHQYHYQDPRPTGRAGTCEDGLCVVESLNTAQRSLT